MPKKKKNTDTHTHKDLVLDLPRTQSVWDPSADIRKYNCTTSENGHNCTTDIKKFMVFNSLVELLNKESKDTLSRTKKKSTAISRTNSRSENNM